ncbi:MAG TPA: ABC transporter permease, partial [Gemmatimonadaceae bacterium]
MSTRGESARKPPAIATWLVRRASPAAERQFILGDLREAFDERVASIGLARARRWYWRDALASLAPLAARRFFIATHRSSIATPGDSMWTSLLADLRHAARLSRRGALASFAVIATMILGVGSTTAVFSAMNAVLLRPLPFPHSERVVQLQGTLRDGRVIQTLAYPDLVDFQQTVPDFADLTVFQTNQRTLQHGSEPRLVHFVDVDDAYPRIFGTRIALGRGFTSEDAKVDAAPVVVLSNPFWASEFGSDRAIIGRIITLDDSPVQVVGVLAADAYTFPDPHADALEPLTIQPNTPMTNRGAMWAGAAALLKPGAVLAQTNRDLSAAAASIAQRFPNANRGISANAIGLRDAVVGSVAPMLELLAAAVAAVLLIACLNIANLILGRAQMRTREFAIRAALGGSPARVRRQVFTESLLLALIGGALGVALSPSLTHAIVGLYPTALPRANEVGIDMRVLLFASLTTLLAGVLSAIPSARRAARLDLSNDLRDGGRSGAGFRDRRFGRVLIVSQVAASLALLFAAGLLLRTFERLTTIDPGFDPRGVMTFHVFASSARYAEVADFDRYYANAAAALRAIPGVKEVSSTTMMPFGSGRFYDIFFPNDRGDQGANNPAAAVSFVAPGFERALGISVLRGRAFTPSDDSIAPRVVMINESLAKRHFPGRDPIGQTITWNTEKDWRIIGVLRTAHLDSLSEEAMPILYTSMLQSPKRSRYFVVRADTPPDQFF